MRFGLIGAGRVGSMHAELVALHPRASLVTVFDANASQAAAVAEAWGAAPAASTEAVRDDPTIDAVVICTPPNTHAGLIETFTLAGKAVLCEKPVDVDMARVDACIAALGEGAKRVQVGLNRRYDPDFVAVKQAIAAGEAGTVSIVSITSRDAVPTAVENIPDSGGLFRNTTIHDFDIVRFLLDDEPVSLQAFAAVHVNPAYGELGDVDTAVISMRMRSGALVQINNSRRAVYGYDQRVEIFGSGGMLQTGNPPLDGIARYTGETTAGRKPYIPTYRVRYRASFKAQLDDFIARMEAGEEPAVSLRDGRIALQLADAALHSARSAQVVHLDGAI